MPETVASKKQRGKGPIGKVRVTAYLSPAFARQVKVKAAAGGKTLSTLVEESLKANLRGGKDAT